LELTVTLEQPDRRDVLFGPADAHLRKIREALGVQMFARGNSVKITGASRNVSRAASVLAALQRQLRGKQNISNEAVADAIGEAAAENEAAGSVDVIDVYNGRVLRPRSPGQRRYVEAMRTHDMVFCLGPAGTGKTYLAVAIAVNMLKAGTARRLILARPAVEAGEKLGFLPGDMQAKVNPYLRPLFDALHDMMDFEQSARLMASDVIEVIPLAFMRGRTLNDSVIILDEAQNTTSAQMLMILTRMGHGSKMIITGDDSQIDLPGNVTSGLIEAQRVLKGIKGLMFVRLDKADIVRHRLVQNIVDAYARQRDTGNGSNDRPPEPADEGGQP
jgi:phosphate starvation-inducible PhoH-like protein